MYRINRSIFEVMTLFRNSRTSKFSDRKSELISFAILYGIYIFKEFYSYRKNYNRNDGMVYMEYRKAL